MTVYLVYRVGSPLHGQRNHEEGIPRPDPTGRRLLLTVATSEGWKEGEEHMNGEPAFTNPHGRDVGMDIRTYVATHIAAAIIASYTTPDTFPPREELLDMTFKYTDALLEAL